LLSEIIIDSEPFTSKAVAIITGVRSYKFASLLSRTLDTDTMDICKYDIYMQLNPWYASKENFMNFHVTLIL